jgi:hypothetical protein
MEQLPRDTMLRSISPYLAPKDFIGLSMVSKNFYELNIYKDNYLYYESLKKFWPNEAYNHNLDYIYRYKRILNFVKNMELRFDGSDDFVDESLFYVTNRDELHYLLYLGADINYEGSRSEVTLIIFVAQSNTEKSDLFRAILENGGDIAMGDMFDFTAYYHALTTGKMDIINICHENKYNILNELYKHNIINPEMANINNTNIDLLVDKLKEINYTHQRERDLVIEIVMSCIEK